MSKKPPIESDPDHDLEQIKNFYDSVYYSGAEAEATTAGRIHKHYLRLFDRLNLNGSQQVLDVACGTGG